MDRAASERLLAGAGLAYSVRDQVVAEAEGNPLALLELSRELTAEERSGSLAPFPQHRASPGNRVQMAFNQRVAALPEQARRAVLIAALKGTADLVTLGSAVTAGGGSLSDLAAAERAGLLRVDRAGVAFSHPLARAAALACSDIDGRTAAHRALARVSDDDRRAWHLAALAAGPDEEVAAGLDAVAERAGSQGSPAAMSAAYEEAARLSESAAAKGRRLTLAATGAAEAGQLARAEGLAVRASTLANDPALLSQLAALTARLRYEADQPIEAASTLLETAERARHSDARESEALAAQAVLYLWRGAASTSRKELERRAARLLPQDEARMFEFLQAVWRLQDGTGQQEGQEEVVVPAPPGPPGPKDVLPFPNSFPLAFDLVLGDLAAGMSRAVSFVAQCQDVGKVGLLAHALGYLARHQSLAGRYEEAKRTVEEALGIAADTGQAGLAGRLAAVSAEIAAVTGEGEECQARAAEARGLSAGVWSTSQAGADCALARLDLGRARYGPALERLQELTAGPWRHAHVVLYAYPDQVEAAVRAGRPELATEPLARFTAWADATQQAWSSAVAARCAALVADGAGAERLYSAALAAHDGDGRPFEQARTHLNYGEWLRRNRRRASARDHLLMAAREFARLGARPWQDRAEAELGATGATAPVPARGDPLARLTPQELQVVRLAAAGASNKQIAARLFLSPRTVGYHLYKAFPKLGVTSRGQLAQFSA